MTKDIPTIINRAIAGRASRVFRRCSLGGTLFFFIVGQAGAWDLSLDDANSVFQNDRADLTPPNWPDISSGDFDGDGFDDIAVGLTAVDNANEILLMRGGAPPVQGAMSSAASLVVALPPVGGFGENVRTTMGDLNGDGKSDLVIWANWVSLYPLVIIFGRTAVPPSWDLVNNDPDTKVSGLNVSAAYPCSFAVGDWTGDGVDDLVVGSPISDGYVHIIAGRTHFPSILNVQDDTSSWRIDGASSSGLGTHVYLGKINHDDNLDLVVSAPNFDFGGFSKSGEVSVLYGGSPLARVRDLGTQPADVTVHVPLFLEHLDCGGLWDFNGDGHGDLVLSGDSGNGILDGTLFESSTSIDLNPSANFDPLHIIPNTEFSSLKGGDFDGDGKDDLYSIDLVTVSIFPTSESLKGGDFPTTWPTPWTLRTHKGYIRNIVSGDINGDGLDDLILAEEAHSTKYWGGVYVVFGSLPLKDPAVWVDERTPRERLVSAHFSVGGEPVSMRLSGDIEDDVKDTWIPFVPGRRVTVTPSGGPKTLRAEFRNAVGRVSGIAEDTVTLDVDAGALMISNNLVTRERPAVVECPMAVAGRLKAQVWTRTGVKVTDLVDEDRSPGHWPVEWNGSNGQGRRVAPGMYILVIDAGGNEKRTKILVQN